MKLNLKLFVSILLFCICSVSGFAQRSLNLDFELKNYKKYWSTGETNLFRFTLDSLENHSGNYSLKMEMHNHTTDLYDAFFSILPYELVAGKTVELRGWIKTKEVKNGNAGLFLRVDGTSPASLGYDDMHDRGLKADNDWTQVSIKMEVSQKANMIVCGGIFKGEGSVWFDDLELYINGEKYIDHIEPEPKLSLSPKEIAALKKYIYPLRTCEPDGGDTKDLEILGKLIGKSKVVGLGEVSHGSSEIFKMKNRIIQYLATNEEFDLFSMEANMPESYKLNNYTIDGKGNPKKLISNLELWPWRTCEVLDLVKWMYNFNQSGKHIKFTGFDMQLYQGAIDEIRQAFQGNEKVEKIIADLENKLKEHQTKIWQFFTPNPAESDVCLNEADSALFALKEHIERSPFPEAEKKWLLQNVTILLQNMSMQRGGDINIRDSAMAENFIWIKEQNPNSKFMIWAHNTHIMKTTVKDVLTPIYTVMGNHLSRKLNKDYINFGFTFFDGNFTSNGKEGLTAYESEPAIEGTLEYLLNQINEPIFILDLKKIKADKHRDTKWLLNFIDYRAAGGLKAVGYLNEFHRQRKIADDFDYLIFIKHTSPSQLLTIDEKQSWYNRNGEQTTTTAEFNLDFENIRNDLPLGWQVNGTDNVKFSMDSVNSRSGKYSAMIDCSDGTSEFGLYGLIIPDDYSGDQITLSGYVKTENITDGYASLVLRVDPEIGSDEIKISGTSDWKKYEVTVKMTQKKNRKFAISAVLNGKGRVWFDDLQIFINGVDIRELNPISQETSPVPTNEL